MNIISYLKKNAKFVFLIIISVFSFTSCENEFANDDPYASTRDKQPVITSVSEAREDVAVTQGVLEGVYIIRGENLASMVSIQFNGYLAGFNPALLTDKIAFVKVPLEAPYVDQPNIMRIETLGGVVEYDFSLLTIEEFTEGTVDGKKVVNLIGGDFTDTSSVTFVSGSEEDGNLVEKPANFTVISASLVQAEVPPGVEQAFIYLATSRGAVAQSESYGFTYSIYIDALNADWNIGGWGGSQDLASTEVKLGEYSIKSIREGWAGLTFLPENANIVYKDYKSISVQIYGVGNILSVSLALNDFSSEKIQLNLTPGQWKKFVIPLSSFYPNGGEPEKITRIDFQESSNTGLSQYIFYVDDFGFI